ncbi:MAG: GNAT family N-acetyltransferase [Oscillibacter sp.]|nr:GNAT family N-acetyltransferase [Oscillibacter sp.]
MKNAVFLAKESLINLSGKLLRQTGDAPVESEQLIMFKTDVISSGYCRTYINMCPAGEEAAMAARLAEDIRAGARPPLVMLAEEEAPGLSAELEKQGFTVKKRQNGMVMNAADYEVREMDPHVERITEAELPQWSAVCTVGFNRKEDQLETIKRFYQDPTCLFYGYRLDGQIVATLMLSLQPGNAGIHEVATLPECRGRGCCRALLNRSIADARDLGYPVISLQASVYGEPIYASVGMEVVSHMVTYILK